MLHLTEADVARRLDMDVAIAAVLRGLTAEANGATAAHPKQVLPFW
ncbi:hypothetical protein GI374_15005 [Paracoccus sp. S-4012]|nr:hypothetical protein [Paracoccus sp. S-4012]MRX51711.1 hypothetical protein [Paracoccus sp. S-4012]